MDASLRTSIIRLPDTLKLPSEGVRELRMGDAVRAVVQDAAATPQGDRAVIRILGHSLIADTQTLLTKGEVLRLEVASLQPHVELRIIAQESQAAQPTTVQDAAAMRGMLLEALRQAGGALAETAPNSAQSTAVQNAMLNLAAQPAADQIRQVLMNLNQPVETILRTVLQANSELPFELIQNLRAALASAALDTSSAAQTPQTLVRSLFEDAVARLQGQLTLQTQQGGKGGMPQAELRALLQTLQTLPQEAAQVFSRSQPDNSMNALQTVLARIPTGPNQSGLPAQSSPAAFTNIVWEPLGHSLELLSNLGPQPLKMPGGLRQIFSQQLQQALNLRMPVEALPVAGKWHMLVEMARVLQAHPAAGLDGQAFSALLEMTGRSLSPQATPQQIAQWLQAQSGALQNLIALQTGAGSPSALTLLPLHWHQALQNFMQQLAANIQPPGQPSTTAAAQQQSTAFVISPSDIFAHSKLWNAALHAAMSGVQAVHQHPESVQGILQHMEQLLQSILRETPQAPAARATQNGATPALSRNAPLLMELRSALQTALNSMASSGSSTSTLVSAQQTVAPEALPQALILLAQAEAAQLRVSTSGFVNPLRELAVRLEAHQTINAFNAEAARPLHLLLPMLGLGLFSMAEIRVLRENRERQKSGGKAGYNLLLVLDLKHAGVMQFELHVHEDRIEMLITFSREPTLKRAEIMLESLKQELEETGFKLQDIRLLHNPDLAEIEDNGAHGLRYKQVNMKI
ncbi:hypothetical protein JXA32_03120 [Candidatus Sumerlaeota bacterium]|nr:hypothetical protein [Candidatus Sumerlaeota bacterium]